LPQLTASPPPECFSKDPKDQIIESLKQSLTLALKSVSTLQMDLLSLQQSVSKGKSLNMKDLEQTNNNQT